MQLTYCAALYNCAENLVMDTISEVIAWALKSPSAAQLLLSQLWTYDRPLKGQRDQHLFLICLHCESHRLKRRSSVPYHSTRSSLTSPGTVLQLDCYEKVSELAHYRQPGRKLASQVAACDAECALRVELCV